MPSLRTNEDDLERDQLLARELPSRGTSRMTPAPSPYRGHSRGRKDDRCLMSPLYKLTPGCEA
jgi:hypothetical protein